MKWFRNRRSAAYETERPTLAGWRGGFLRPGWVGKLLVGALLAASAAALRPGALVLAAEFSHTISGWLQNAVAGSPVEAALYRAMQLPAGTYLFRRPPHEALPEIAQLIARNPGDASLWQLKALEDERALDFDAAERDWKTWAEKAPDKSASEMELADFYERRLRPQDELAALEAAGRPPASQQEGLTQPQDQQAWQAWQRAIDVAQQYNLPRAVAKRDYRAWEERYPQEKSVYDQEFAYLLDGRDFSAASDLISRYRNAFPQEQVAPVQYEAELAAKRGAPQDGLAVYDRNFQPLWPDELVRAWYQLLVQGREVRRVSDELRTKIGARPDDLIDAARLFYIDQQQGQTVAAQQVLEDFRKRRDTAGQAWTDVELDTLAQLYEKAQNIPEAARYYYALAANHGPAGEQQQALGKQEGLAGLARLLLNHPEQPLRVGAANLALYRDIATMDRGPGYLNGILSLLLNSSSPDSELAQEDQLAVPYYHRAKAAEIVTLIDKQFPNARERADLHARLIEAYQAYGDNDAVIREGTAFLAAFPQAPQRVQVALQTADAYDRTGQIEKEFAIYQKLLTELAARAGGVPLGSAGSPVFMPQYQQVRYAAGAQARSAQTASGSRSPQYADVLNRYLSRLVSLNRLPDALVVLRGEVERNPQDPGLYERLAQFFEQNRLNSHAEEVYQRAIQQFQNESWYARLARYYLRQRRQADYAALSRKVADVFSGTELEQYLAQAPAPDWQLAHEVHLYANLRFPHDLTFVRDLIGDYARMNQQQEIDKLLWAHWSESPEFRNQLFERLSSSRQLDAVLASLHQQSPQIGAKQWSALAGSNPAAERFWLSACIWQSHFEQAVDAANALSAAYPADTETGSEAASLYRSFAYFHPEDTGKAAAIENRLLNAAPGDLATMARIGDIYADRGLMNDAAPYWLRIGEAHPGDANGYLQAATVFWDYFDFSHALEELRTARRRLDDPTLFGYQAGAILESEGDEVAAVREYVASALGKDQSDQSRGRLLTLAQRPAFRNVVDTATADLLQGNAPAPAAISLRVAVLSAENRRQSMASELNALVARTESFDDLDAIETTAQSESLPDVQQATLRREIALTSDPVRSLQLRYQLVDFLAAQKQTAEASAEIDAIYRESPKILGVVRATVNFDWEHERKPQAVAVLLDAAQASYPDLQHDFQLEAANKLTALGDYARAGALLQTLLAAKPLDPRVDAAMAENYARAGDQAALVAFDRSELAAVRASDLAPGEKQLRIAQLRRSMISAATVLGNWGDAVDQYIELINTYPDDATLAQEAALFADAHNQRNRLFAFYQKTIQNSPHDPRWSIALARLATAAEDLPAAVSAYSQAIALRPERQDLLIAQADLDVRLQRLDDAVADYQKLYALSYHDPQWMQQVAEVRARQGRNTDALQALQTAWIDGRPAKTANFFQVAAQLEKWNLLVDARKFSEQGIAAAGADLLVNGADQNGAAEYARIMARLRQTDDAWTRLNTARQQAGALSLTMLAQQATSSGFAGVSSDEWRRQQQQVRSAAATAGFAQAMHSMATAASEYYTPEEEAGFAAWLRGKSASAGADELRKIYLPTAQAARLPQYEADLRWRLADIDPQHRAGEVDAWLSLQARRVQLDGAGEKIEALAGRAGGGERLGLLRYAADAYRRNGNESAELRVLEELAGANNLGGIELARFYALLLAQRPQELIQRSVADSAAQYVITHGSTAQALAAVQVRAANLPPVWSRAYTALTALYRGAHTAQLTQAFAGALDANAAIGERIAHPENRNEQLAGSVWFYYGSRYGAYLDEQHDAAAEDYLESSLEAAPGNARAYADFADYSAQAERPDLAISDYRHSLELNADQPAVLDRIAAVEWETGRTADALTSWQGAVALLAKEMDASRVPPSFWGDAALVLRDCSASGQYNAIRQPMDAMIRGYLQRNGTYMAEPLLRAGYQANGGSMDWLLQMIRDVPQEQGLLAILRNNNGWVRKDQTSELLARLVKLERAAAQQNPAQSSDQLAADEAAWATALLDEGRMDQARAVLAQGSAQQKHLAAWLAPEIRLAEADKALPQLVAQWKRAGAFAPDPATLRNIAAGLSASARIEVMAYVYEQALAARDFSAPNFLGLAAIRLDDGDTAGAMQLLNRMVLVSGNVYEDMDSAAALLEKYRHSSEAMQFLRPLSQASPWNGAYKVRLARATLAITPHSADALTALRNIAANPDAKYEVRAAAAEALNGEGETNAPAANTELILLAQTGCPTTQQASQPLFVRARVKAAACASDNATKESLLRGALAEQPDNNSIRLLFIWAAFGARQDVRALLAAEPILATAPGYNDYGGNRPYAYDQANAEYRYAGGNDDQGDATVSWLTPSDAGRLYLLVVHALERRRDFDRALNLARQGERLARGTPQQAVLEAERMRLQAITAVDRQNAERAPSIHQQIEQDHVVRPRLAAGTFAVQEVSQ